MTNTSSTKPPQQPPTMPMVPTKTPADDTDTSSSSCPGTDDDSGMMPLRCFPHDPSLTPSTITNAATRGSVVSAASTSTTGSTAARQSTTSLASNSTGNEGSTNPSSTEHICCDGTHPSTCSKKYPTGSNKRCTLSRDEVTMVPNDTTQTPATNTTSTTATNDLDHFADLFVGGKTPQDPVPHRDSKKHHLSTSLKSMEMRGSIASVTSTSSDGNNNNNRSSVTSLSSRLNQMSMQEREHAEFDMHGIPLADEYFDGDIHIQQTELDPLKMEHLLHEMEQIVETKLQHYDANKSHTQKNDTAAAAAVSDNQNKSAAGAFFHGKALNLHGVCLDYGVGLKLARQQNPHYVHEQRIKFLRADRYDTELAAERMIRFFDLKRELFCSGGYNNTTSSNNTNTNDITNCECLGRDLRLTDFSTKDLQLWKASGFLQLCGARDRAKRTIIIVFGKALIEHMIPVELVNRAYMYICNIWSRDVSIQKAGYVIVGYLGMTPVGNNNTGGTPGSTDSAATEQLIDDYLRIFAPLNYRIHMTGMSGQLRGVARHFCYDHPKLHDQFEQLAESMNEHSAARFRCHYAQSYRRPNAKYNQHQELLYTLMTFGIPRDAIPLNEGTGHITLEYNVAILEAIDSREKGDLLAEQHERELEILRQLQRQQQQLQEELDNTEDELARIKMENKEEETTNSEMLTTTQSSSKDESIKDGLWMSLSASVNFNDSAMADSFALFPDTLDDNVENLVQKIKEDDGDHKDYRGYGNRGIADSNKTNSSDLFASLEEDEYAENQQGQSFPATLSLSSLPENPPHQPQDYWSAATSGHYHHQQQQQQVPSSFQNQAYLQRSNDHVLGASSAHQPYFLQQQQQVPLSLEQQQHQERLAGSFPETAPSSSSVTVENSPVSPTTSSSIMGVTSSSSTTRANGDNIVMKANPYDIIMGRGQWHKFHPGNMRFKDTLAREREQYEAANRFVRMQIVDNMLEGMLSSESLPPIISSGGVGIEQPAPRFLYKEKTDAAATKQNKKSENTGKQEDMLLGPWLIATTEKAHDKITHDFRNMRRQKKTSK